MADSIKVVNPIHPSEAGRIYADLLPALQRLDHVLEQAIAAAQSTYGPEAAADPYRGLHLNQDEVLRLLARAPGKPLLWACAQPTAPREVNVTADDHAVPALEYLERSYELSSFDLDVILLALAAEIDLRYERLFAYLQDDVTKRRPSVDLALNLLCASAEEKLSRREHFSPSSRLIRNGLLRLITDSSQTQPPLLAHYLKLDEQIANLLMGQTALDSRLKPFCELSRPHTRVGDPSLSSELTLALPVLVRRARETRQPIRFYFSGPRSGTKLRTAEALAGEIGLPLLTVDLSYLQTVDADGDWWLELLFREAWFRDALLYLDRFDSLRPETRNFQYERLWKTLVDHPGVVILAGEQTSATTDAVEVYGPVGLVNVGFSIPGFTVRRECWRTSLDAAGIRIGLQELETLAGRFRLTHAQIAEAVADARNRAIWRTATQAAAESSDGSSSEPNLADLNAAARTQSQHQLGTLARKIEPFYQWSDIVLPKDAREQLRELCSRVAGRHRVLGEWGFGRKLSLGKGVSALFAGASGVGKTMAAEIIANELGLDLYKIDLSTVVSKYIGETEKALDRIFAAAENSNGIVFIDECDSLMGKRSEVRDAHDRYANIEIAYLLQKMEEYEGIVILATNLRQNLDESFVRRLTFTVHFPFPDENDRRRIWDSIWPQATPLANDLNFDFLARQFKLSGGNIKNIALAAAFLAAADGGVVSMPHLIQATRREYQKLGKPLGPAELGSFGLEMPA